MARLLVQNGQYATWTEPTAVRDQRKLFEQYAPLYEAAVRAVEQAKSGLEGAQSEAQDTRSVDQATNVADIASRSAVEKSVKADAARDPVRQFRSGAWYGIAGLAFLALGCGAVSLLRPQGRLPLGFSTLGSVGLAAFLFVASGWGDDSRATAASVNPGQGSAKVTDHSGLAEAPAERAGRAAHAEVAPMPVAPTAPNAALAPSKSGVHANTGQAPAGVVKADDGGLGMGFSGLGGLGAGGGLGGMPGKPAGGFGSGNTSWHDVRPPFALPGAGLGSRMDVKPKMAAPGMPPAPGGSGTPPPGPPVTVQPPAPPSGPLAAGRGWNPNRPNGVSWVDIVASEEENLLVGRGQAKPTGRLMEKAAEQKDALKKTTDLAARYALKRATDLAPVLAPYFARDVKPQTLTFLSADRFAAQLRGAVTPIPPLVVREFAAPRPTSIALADADTPDTVLWQPVIVLPGDGKATLNFHLGAARGGYEVMIAGHTADGRLGATRGRILVIPPSSVSPGNAGTPGEPGGLVPPVMPVAPAPQQAPPAPPAP
jgi:hypothetical protein